MNRISTIRPIPFVYGKDAGEAYNQEFKRRRDRIADKPISLGVNYSANETPSEPTETARFESAAPHYTSLQYEREQDWRRTKLIFFVVGLVLVLVGAGKVLELVTR